MGSIGNLNDQEHAIRVKNQTNFTANKLLESGVQSSGSQNSITIIEQCEGNEERQNEQQQEEEVQLSDFIGEHGPYQFSLTVLLFIRYVLLGLMANSGPLMTPDVTFYCSLPMTEVISIMPNISTLSPSEQALEIREEFKQVCQIDLHLYQNQSQLLALNASRSFRTSPLGKIGNLNLNFTSTMLGRTPRIRECVDFTYDLAENQGTTMTSEFDLVCDRDWLRSLYQSLLSAAIVAAHVFWGTFSDKYGRFQAQRLCLIVSLVAGLLSIFASNFWNFTLARAFCSFGDLGLVVSQTTILVELVGQRYRGLSVALVNFGFAFGVSLLPYLMAYFEDFRLVAAVTVLCHMITIPFILATNESPRWLLTNRKFKPARKELKRIARWNKACESFWKSARFPFSFRNQRSENQDKKFKRVSSREQKQQFELLFNKFTEQIESQNLYDPVANIAHVNNNSRSDSLKDESTIVQQPKIRTTLLSSENIQSNTFVNIDINSLSKDSAPRLDQMQQPSSVEPESMESSTTSNNDNASRDSCITIDGDQSPLSASSLPITKRAISCNQLDAESSKFFELNCSFGMDQQALKQKILILPSSIYNGRDELYDQPIRRRRDDEANNQHQQRNCITSCNMVAHQLSFVGRVSQLFSDKKLMVAVFAIVWTTFNSELLYTSFIIINLEVGEDVYLNYILGGCMEALAAVSASLLLSYASRRTSLIAFWLLISISCFGLSLAHIDSTWAVWMLALAKFSQSSLSSIASVAAYESFPTFLRQSGSGLISTLGMMGSVFAPLIFAEFDDQAGMDRVLMTFSCSSLTAATLIFLFLNETRGCELK